MLVALVGCSAPAPLQTLAASPTPTPTESTEPDGTSARPYDFGVLAPSDAGSMWDVTLSEPSIDASALVAQSNEFNQPAGAGNQYVTVRISAITNEDIPADSLDQPVSPGFSIGAAFVGNDGHIYETTTTYPFIEGDWISTPDILARPGVEVSGLYLIEVPATAMSGGQFATRNLISGGLLYFGEPLG